MKSQVLNLGVLCLSVFLTFSCKPKHDENQPNQSLSPASFDILVEAMPNENAPSLQSYVHGIHGDEWLLFAGRTNQKDDNGGLHNMNANYSNTSFPPPSFNDRLYAYNPVSDEVKSITIEELKNRLRVHFPKNFEAMKKFESVFKNSNPVVNQDGEFLYVIGGYGAKNFKDKPKSKGIQNYVTYNHIAKLHVPGMLKIIHGDYEGINKEKLMAFAKDTTNTLISTGGELMLSGTEGAQNLTLYMTGGQCFGNNCATGQKYVDAAYPFSLKTDEKHGKPHDLIISFSHAISDVSDPKGAAADNISAMRRRDGPIVPALYKSPVSGSVQQGFAFFSGVFKAGADSDLQAWNDAIYIHPDWASQDNVLYTYDRDYDQKNYNVYAAPNFVVYEADNEITNTYILGGIGDGKKDPGGFLSGFTNTGMRIETQIVTDFTTGQVINSLNEVYSQNVYGDSDKNEPNFYGAEAIFFLKNEAFVYEINNGTNSKGVKYPNTKTEIIELSRLKDSETVIGYVFGGIEAFVANPASYGPSKSRASKKVFKVTLKKK